MRLPFYERSIVSEAKIVDYLLNPDHPQGRSKARFFLGLGFRRDQPDELRRALLKVAATAEIRETVSGFGRKFACGGEIEAPNGRTVRVMTVWILPDGDPTPVLVTAYPLS